MADRSDSRGATEPVVKSSGAQATTITSKAAASDDRLLRAMAPEGEGLLVCLYSLPHLTDPDVLKVPFFFQCPPLDTFSRSYAYDFSTYQTLRHGEMASPQGKRLTVVSFATLFLAYSADTTFEVDPAPMRATRTLVSLMRTGTPFGFSAGNHGLYGASFDVHFDPKFGNAAILTAVDVEERAGETDARYVNVSFQEYRDPKLNRRRKGQGKNRDEGRGRKLPALVNVHANGDVFRDGKLVVRDATLRKLAKFFYGEQTSWQVIASKNGVRNFAASRPLSEYMKLRKEKSPIPWRVPKLKIASTNPPTGGAGASQSTTSAD